MPEVGWPDFAAAAQRIGIDAELLTEFSELVRLHRGPF